MENKKIEDVEDIVINYLKDNGFDGLCTDGCGCVVNDLVPCGGPFESCKPGYRVAGCTPACGEGCDFHVTTVKPENVVEAMGNKETNGK